MGKRTVGKFLVSMNCVTVCLFGSVYMESSGYDLVFPNVPLIFFSRDNLIQSDKKREFWKRSSSSSRCAPSTRHSRVKGIRLGSTKMEKKMLHELVAT